MLEYSASRRLARSDHARIIDWAGTRASKRCRRQPVGTNRALSRAPSSYNYLTRRLTVFPQAPSHYPELFVEFNHAFLIAAFPRHPDSHHHPDRVVREVNVGLYRAGAGGHLGK